MKVSDLGEFGLIDLLNRTLQECQAPHERENSGLLVGIGDDAALWKIEGALELATTDTMVEDVHFRLGMGTWRDLGWKALAVNISDIAAMGGIPGYALVTLGLSPDTPVDGIVELYRGMAEAAEVYGAVVAGGDIVRAPFLMITVSMSGRPATPGPSTSSGRGNDCDTVLLRSKARPGNVVAVTGYLGSSAGGLRCLNGEGAGSEDDREYLRMAHLRPAPRVSEGQALIKAGVKAAMDISDGTVADLSKLCAASGVSATINSELLPVHPALKRAFPEEWMSYALYGGEDYELLFTASEEQVAAARKGTEAVITVIGRIEAGEPGRVKVLDQEGVEISGERGGWDHLKAER